MCARYTVVAPFYDTRSAPSPGSVAPPPLSHAFRPSQTPSAPHRRPEALSDPVDPLRCRGLSPHLANPYGDFYGPRQEH